MTSVTAREAPAAQTKTSVERPPTLCTAIGGLYCTCMESEVVSCIVP